MFILPAYHPYCNALCFTWSIYLSREHWLYILQMWIYSPAVSAADVEDLEKRLASLRRIWCRRNYVACYLLHGISSYCLHIVTMWMVLHFGVFSYVEYRSNTFYENTTGFGFVSLLYRDVLWRLRFLFSLRGRDRILILQHNQIPMELVRNLYWYCRI